MYRRIQGIRRLTNSSNVNEIPKSIPELNILKQRISQGENITIEEYFNSNHFKFKNETDITAKLNYLKQSIHLLNSNKPLICIDCEAFEKNQKYITEIGISILNQIQKTTIVPQIKTYHIIIEDHLKKRNKLYVPDYKYNFLNGKSIIMSETNTKEFLKKFLEKYLINQHGVLIGHNLSSEVKFFKKLGVELNSNKSIDTLILHQLSRSNGGSLWAILRSLNIPYSFLHNAGNDAYYTMLIALNLLDPIIRINYDLDIYQISKYSGKGQHHHKVSVEKCNNVDKLIEMI
ncbi:unnamed protein product [Candida verbasci]|uniref:Gfd2/YDR514C-like C-terminal domain-containing protein n=1 Tax=Candida verbasci TaxID=1227364 RepID=A0A9W4XCD1_9ASCO|nr:unnamed protein product [Candida verbasci]